MGLISDALDSLMGHTVIKVTPMQMAMMIDEHFIQNGSTNMISQIEDAFRFHMYKTFDIISKDQKFKLHASRNLNGYAFGLRKFVWLYDQEQDCFYQIKERDYRKVRPILKAMIEQERTKPLTGGSGNNVAANYYQEEETSGKFWKVVIGLAAVGAVIWFACNSSVFDSSFEGSTAENQIEESQVAVTTDASAESASTDANVSQNNENKSATANKTTVKPFNKYQSYTNEKAYVDGIIYHDLRADEFLEQYLALYVYRDWISKAGEELAISKEMINGKHYKILESGIRLWDDCGIALVFQYENEDERHFLCWKDAYYVDGLYNHPCGLLILDENCYVQADEGFNDSDHPVAYSNLDIVDWIHSLYDYKTMYAEGHSSSNNSYSNYGDYSDYDSDSGYSFYSDYILPYSDSEYLSTYDLEGFTKEECRLARNEIYARKGRMFDDEELQEYFDSQDWYEPYYTPDEFKESFLNEYEIYNRDLIVEYEEYMGWR